MVKDQLEKNALANIAVCIFECDQNNVLERWVVDLRAFPVVDRKEKDTPFARVEDEESESGANETLLRRTVNRADLEAQFRAVLSRLSVSAAKLAPLPSGDDAPELSFTLTMEVRDEADRPTGRRRLSEQGWIAAEPEAFESPSDEDETHLVAGHAARAEGKTVPIRRLETGELRMEVWVEESKAKFAMNVPATASSQQPSSESQQFDPDKGYVLDSADVDRPQPPSMASDYRR